MMKQTIIRGGLVYDGSGAAPRETDILIEGDRIAAIGFGLAAGDAELINATGKVVCPGFIDIHRHCDAAVFVSPDFGDIELAQGITSTVAGNCGMAPVPFNPHYKDEAYSYIEPVMGKIPPGFPFENYSVYADGLQNLKLPLNMGFLAGAGAVKTAVKGFAKTPFSKGEMQKACDYIREAMTEGAFGLSFGIMYQSECYSSRQELIAQAKAAAFFGGVLCTHIRGEGDSLCASVEEMVAVAAAAEIPLNISHFKATGIKNWRSAIFRAIECIEAARSKGQKVTADFYPYTGGSTTLMSLLPPSALEDTLAETLEKLAGPGGKDFLRRELMRDHSGWDNMALSIGWDRVLISSVYLSEHENYCGRNVEDIAHEKGFDDPADLLTELILSEEGRTGIIVLSMAAEDVDEICRLPWTALISDSLYGGGANPHPRLYGAFPKFLREYVRERKILTMEEAIHKMTAMPAERVGIRQRGLLAPSYYADLVIFDPQNFTDHADYVHPKQRATGMDLVMINGAVVRRNDAAIFPSGRFLKKN